MESTFITKSSNKKNQYIKKIFLPKESTPNCSIFIIKDGKTSKQFLQKEIKTTRTEMNKIYENEYLQSFNSKNTLHFINIIDIFYSKDSEKLIVRTEYLQNNILKLIASKMSQKTYFSEYNILELFTQTCLAIKSLHDNKIIYRNLDPNKIFVCNGNIVKLGDCLDIKGLSYTHEKAITFTGFDLYCSPEIIIGHPYSFKSDIWSLGAFLFHLSTLKYPFNNIELNYMKNVKKFDKFKLIDKIPKHYSNNLKTLVGILLDFEPLNRPDITKILTFIYEKYFIYNSIIKIGHKPWINSLKEIYQKKVTLNDVKEKLRVNVKENNSTLLNKTNNNSYSTQSIFKISHLNQKIVGLEDTYKPNQIISGIMRIDLSKDSKNE